MRFECRIALRYLFARRKQAFITIISLFSILGVALGVATLIVVLGVMNGMNTDLRDKILAVTSHVVVQRSDGGFTDVATPLAQVRAIQGVTAATPFIYTEVMASTRSGVKGVVLRGLDPALAEDVLAMDNNMLEGRLSDLAPPPGSPPDAPPRIIVGKGLADYLALHMDGHVDLISPSGQQAAAGYLPKAVSFQVAGIFDTGIQTYDASLAYTTLDGAATLLGFGEIQATGLELRVKDIFQADTIARRAAQILGPPYETRDWKEMNANFFAALSLQKNAMAIILAMIVLVAAFSIVTTLILLIMEKNKDIAILMSMGATTRQIGNIFILLGTTIGFIGTALGFSLGLLASHLLKEYQFIKLPEKIYSLSYLPVLHNPTDLILIALTALTLTFLATLYPARKAARQNPAQLLR